MVNEMKNSKSSTIGEKISTCKYLIVKPIIYSKYKLGLGTKKPTTIKPFIITLSFHQSEFLFIILFKNPFNSKYLLTTFL